MVKNNKIVVKVDNDTLENFNKKCIEQGLNRTEYIEKIANNDIIFLDRNAKKVINLINQ